MGGMEEDLEPLLHSAFRYALALTHEPAEAQDLVHDACLSMLSASAGWGKAYLFAAVRNRYIDRYRRNRKLLFLSIDGDTTLAEIPDGAREPDEDRQQRVARDGSWFCSPNYCGAYRPGFRGKSPPDRAFNNLGFRCAKDP